jgi:pyochelin biosynthetic protein PchC
MTPASPGGAALRRFHAVAEPRARLVCLPHAGGAATAYRSWHQHLPTDVEVVAVQYPARQDRIGDPPVTDLAELADAIAADLAGFADRPLAVFGHSMGALVAFEVTRRLERAGTPPTWLFASAQAAPHRYVPDTTHLGGDAAIVAEVKRLGDVDPALFDIPDLLDLVLPAMRADFQLLGGYRPEPGARTAVPVVAHVGDRDPDLTTEDVRAWAEVTTGPAETRTWAGDHFYLVPHAAELVADLGRRLLDRA